MLQTLAVTSMLLICRLLLTLIFKNDFFLVLMVLLYEWLIGFSTYHPKTLDRSRIRLIIDRQQSSLIDFLLINSRKSFFSSKGKRVISGKRCVISKVYVDYAIHKVRVDESNLLNCDNKKRPFWIKKVQKNYIGNSYAFMITYYQFWGYFFSYLMIDPAKFVLHFYWFFPRTVWTVYTTLLKRV